MSPSALTVSCLAQRCSRLSRYDLCTSEKRTLSTKSVIPRRHRSASSYRVGPRQSCRHQGAGIRVQAASTAHVDYAHDEYEEDEVDENEEQTPPPPLPASALELLSDLLTGIATQQVADPASSSGLDVRSSAYKPQQFCVNCCRPLPNPGVTCTGCGHDPSQDAQVLGDAHAWIEAYAQQLKKQQGADQAAQLQQADGPSVPPRGEPAQVLLAADARTLLHRSSLPPYPGRPERLQAIMSRLHSTGLLERCRLLDCRPAEDPELLAVHSRELVAAVRGMGVHSHAEAGGEEAGGAAASAPAVRPSVLCPDTLYNAHTCTAALLAAGAAADLGRALAAGRARSAVAVMRPPGAQAGADLARGGCYLNNVAVAASAALASGVQRVMVVDWDVHHGRGTQEIFEDDPRVMVVSMHRYDSETYPGSGAVDEVGEGEGEGTTLNVAFSGGGLVDGDLLSAALHVVLPVAYQFRPQVVLVVAGFGALKGDPIGGCNCSPAVFAHLTHLLTGVAPLGVGLLLEGGYNLRATAEAVEGCVRVLLGEAPPPLPGPWGTTSAGWVAIMNAMQIHSHFWSALHPLSFNGWTSAIQDQQRQMQQQARERELELQQMQKEQGQEHELLHHHQQAQRQPHHQSSPQSASFGALSSATNSWMEVDVEEDGDQQEGDEAAGTVGMDALAQVAAALRQDKAGAQAPQGWAERDDDGDGEEGELGGLLGEIERADPRDIDPAELLDVFLGTGDYETERVTGGAMNAGGAAGSSSGAEAKPVYVGTDNKADDGMGAGVA